jgi:hypothetical protein
MKPVPCGPRNKLTREMTRSPSLPKAALLLNRSPRRYRGNVEGNIEPWIMVQRVVEKIYNVNGIRSVLLIPNKCI